MSDFIAFDGTRLNTQEELERFNRKALEKLMKKDWRCPFIAYCDNKRGCIGSKEEVEACFGVVFDMKVMFT